MLCLVIILFNKLFFLKNYYIKNNKFDFYITLVAGWLENNIKHYQKDKGYKRETQAEVTICSRRHLSPEGKATYEAIDTVVRLKADEHVTMDNDVEREMNINIILAP